MSRADAIHILPRNTTWRRKVTMMAWLRALVGPDAPPTHDPPETIDDAFQLSVTVLTGSRVFTDTDLGGNFGIHKLIAATTAQDISAKTWLELVQMIYFSTSPILSAKMAERGDTFPWKATQRHEEVRKYWRAVLYTMYMQHFRGSSVEADAMERVAKALLQPTVAWTNAPPSDLKAQPLDITIKEAVRTLRPFSPLMGVMGEIVERIVQQATDRVPYDDDVSAGLIPADIRDIWRDPNLLNGMRLSKKQTTKLHDLASVLGRTLTRTPGRFWEKEPYEDAWYVFFKAFRKDARSNIKAWVKANGVPDVVAAVFLNVWDAIPTKRGILDVSPLHVIANAVNSSELSTLTKNPYQVQPDTNYILSQAETKEHRMSETMFKIREEVEWFRPMHRVGDDHWWSIFNRLVQRIDQAKKFPIKARIISEDKFNARTAAVNTIYLVSTENGKYYEWGVWYKKDALTNPIWTIPALRAPINKKFSSNGIDGRFDPSVTLLHTQDYNNPLLTAWVVLMLASGYTREQIHHIPSVIDMIAGPGYMVLYLTSDFIIQRDDIFGIVLN